MWSKSFLTTKFSHSIFLLKEFSCIWKNTIIFILQFYYKSLALKILTICIYIYFRCVVIKKKQKRSSQPEAFCKKGFLKKISQSSQESICIGNSFLIKLQIWGKIFKEYLFLKNTNGDAFWQKQEEIWMK